MKTESKNLWQGSYRVFLPTVTLPPSVQFYDMSVTQRIQEHDLATFRVRSYKVNLAKYLAPGTPIRITFRAKYNNKFRGEFVGYVSHIRAVMDSDMEYERDIVCVGASQVLRETAQVTYRSKTPADVVAEVSRKFRFSPIVKQDGLRKDTITQSGETYWQFLHRLAKKTGYVLKAEGTSLIFMPVTEYASAFIDRAPMLMDYADFVNGSFESPNVIEIDSLTGATSLDPERLTDEAVFSSINPVTSEVTFQYAKPSSGSRSSRSPYKRYLSAQTVSYTPYEAKLLAKGASDNGLMALDARMKVAGNVLLSPYRPVQLNLRDANLTGLWLVKEVTHTISRKLDNSYYCQLTVSTDSVDGIPRRKFTGSSANTVNIQQRLISPSSGSGLIASSRGFVVGAASSTLSSWVTR